MERARFLDYRAAQQLLDDLYMEVDPTLAFEDNRSDMPEFGFIAWFLRTYFYLPMSAIQELMKIEPGNRASKGSRANKVIETYKASCQETPESLDAGRYDLLQEFKSLAANFYSAPTNKPLDLCSEDEEDCLLYLAHLEIGRYDNGKRQGGSAIGYKLTPKEPAIITLLDILARIEHGEDPEDIARNYEFKSTY